MFIASFMAATAIASKWLIVAKVATVAGGCCIAVDKALKEAD